jgi:hypothetical protein
MTHLANGGNWATRLILLDISGCKNVCIQGFACLSSSSSSHVPHLTHLDVSSCNLCFEFWPWEHTPPLQILNLARNTVSIATIHTLAMHCGKTLTRLDLDHAIWPPFHTTTSALPTYPSFDNETSSFESLCMLNLSHWGPWHDWRAGLTNEGGFTGHGSNSNSSSSSGGVDSSESMTNRSNERLCGAAEESLLSMVTRF